MALDAIFAGLKALIAADSAVTALLATAPTGAGGGPAIYDEGAAPQGGSYPYVTVGLGTMAPFGTFQSPGWNCTVQVKVVGRGNESAGQAIVTALATLLRRGRALTVTGYTSAWCDEFVVQPTIVTTLAGVVTREWPVILRVFAT